MLPWWFCHMWFTSDPFQSAATFSHSAGPRQLILHQGSPPWGLLVRPFVEMPFWVFHYCVFGFSLGLSQETTVQ